MIKLTTTLISEYTNVVEYFFKGGFSLVVRTYTGSHKLGYQFNGCMTMEGFTELLIGIQKNKEKIKKDIYYKGERNEC